MIQRSWSFSGFIAVIMLAEENYTHIFLDWCFHWVDYSYFWVLRLNPRQLGYLQLHDESKGRRGMQPRLGPRLCSLASLDLEFNTYIPCSFFCQIAILSNEVSLAGDLMSILNYDWMNLYAAALSVLLRQHRVSGLTALSTSHGGLW